jgi:hypothetical protein
MKTLEPLDDPIEVALGIIVIRKYKGRQKGAAMTWNVSQAEASRVLNGHSAPPQRILDVEGMVISKGNYYWVRDDEQTV